MARPSVAKQMAHVTARERDVLRLLCEGLTDKEIAERLGVRYRTVRTHLENLYRKFSVRNRHGLVAEWLRRVTTSP